jgi:hypothetical protein
VRLTPRRTAAPRGPATIPFVSRSTSMMCSRTASYQPPLFRHE